MLPTLTCDDVGNGNNALDVAHTYKITSAKRQIFTFQT